MPDVGVYRLATVRFMTGEEPSEVMVWTHSTPDDPRFREVEETMHFMLRFPSGLRATCHTSYGANKSQMLRLMGTAGWVELNPAYAYKLTHDTKVLARLNPVWPAMLHTAAQARAKCPLTLRVRARSQALGCSSSCARQARP